MTDYTSINADIQGCEASQVLTDPIFTDDSITNFFRIMPNVEGKKRIYYLGNFEDPIRKYSGCGWNPTNGAPMKEREISTHMAEIQKEFCADELIQTAAESLLKKGVNKSDLTNTDLLDAILFQLELAIKRQINGLAFFGDMRIEDVALNICDGLFTVHLPELDALGHLARVVVDQSQDLGPGEADALMAQVYDDQPDALEGINEADKVFMVSKAVYKRLRRDLRELGEDSTLIDEYFRDGIKITRYDGIEVVQRVNWTGYYEKYEEAKGNTVNSGFKGVILTTRDNLVMATDRESDLNTLEVGYERKENEFWIKGNFKIGFDYTYGGLISCAF